MAGELTQQVQGARLDPEIAIQLVSRSLSDRTSIDLASSTWVTTEYARALGYHVRSGAPLSPPPSEAATIGPGFYAGYSPPQAPAGGAVGSTQTSISTCGSVNVKDTVTLHIAANSGGVDNGAWSSWGGTMELSSPYVTSGSEFCSPQSWTFSLTGT